MWRLRLRESRISEPVVTEPAGGWTIAESLSSWERPAVDGSGLVGAADIRWPGAEREALVASLGSHANYLRWP